MSAEGDLRLAVLTAIIAQHGPVPCVHVTRVRKGDVVNFRCEASELRLHGGQVILELRMIGSTEHPCKLPEPTTFLTADSASVARNRLCNVLLCLPWDRTPLGRPLDPEDAAAALRHIEASAAGVKVLPRSTSEISAMSERKTH